MSLLPRKAAIDLAMEVRRRPELASLLSTAPLPRDVKNVLRIAADGTQRNAATAHVYRANPPEAVRDACTAFLSVLLFNRRSDPYRVLGLSPGASEDEVREHKRLLLKWLHPDRNPAGGDGGRNRELLSRVLQAADEIEGRRTAAPSFTPPPRPAVPPVILRTSPPPFEAGAADGPVDGAARNFKPRLAKAVSRSVHGLRRASFGVVAVVGALVLWRYVMQEPIGLSLQRYSQAALGMISW